MSQKIKIYFPKEYGFCGGVANAIKILNETLEKFGAPVYVYHNIVHNDVVLQDFKDRGVVFINDLSEMTDVSRPLILSAHGSSRALKDEIEKTGIKYIDAACPLVQKIHDYVREKSLAGYSVIVIGIERNHDEIVGTMGYAENAFFIKTIVDVEDLPDIKGEVCYVSQTTLPIGETGEIIVALKEKFPDIEGLPAGNICMATTERQTALVTLIAEQKLNDVFVIGSESSSNTKCLLKVALAAGAKNVRLISSVEQITAKDLNGVLSLGITAGAASPQTLIDEVVERIRKLES